MHSIGKVTSVTFEKLIFEVSDFEKLNYNLLGQIYIAKGVIDYVTIKNEYSEKFIYQVVKVEDKEIPLS
ncbi:TPA: ATP-binding protein, partial [Staphylococcus aureus]|nr:ATP-binding protein [Staphylococcus aureus]HDJ5561934.1 ATP-binding protein [Staphylococcus aureus]